MSILLYAHVDAPDAPDWMQQQVYQLLADDSVTVVAKKENWTKNYAYYEEPHVIKNGQTYNSAFNKAVDLDQQSLDWVREHIGPVIRDIRAVKTGSEDAPHKGPHTDISRDYTIIYLMEHGGQDHITCFFREKEHPDIVRPRGYFLKDYDQTEMLCGRPLPMNAWCLINSSVLHSVNNVAQGRISIHLSLDHVENLRLKDRLYIE